MRDPSGLKAAEVTTSVVAAEYGDRRAGRGVPDARGASKDAVTMRDPSGLKAAEVTSVSWPLKVAIASPVSASQRRAVLSEDAVTMRDPSGLKAAELTTLLVAAQNRDASRGRGVPEARGAVVRTQ